MAARPNKTQSVDTNKLVSLFVTLAGFEPTEETPVTVQEVSGEIGENAFDLLGTLADAELIEFERGNVWLAVSDVTEENAESIAREALAGMVTVVEPPKTKRKTAPNKIQAPATVPLADWEQEALKGKAVTVDMAELMQSAGIPVIAENGEKVTIPVDFDDPSKGRRELDASKGERVISEETIRVRTAPAESPKGLDSGTEDGETVHESSIEKQGLALEPVESYPPAPAGVTHNFWVMAHEAITQTARDSWMRRCLAQAEEHKANKGEPAPF